MLKGYRLVVKLASIIHGFCWIWRIPGTMGRNYGRNYGNNDGNLLLITGWLEYQINHCSKSQNIYIYIINLWKQPKCLFKFQVSKYMWCDDLMWFNMWLKHDKSKSRKLISDATYESARQQQQQQHWQQILHTDNQGCEIISHHTISFHIIGFEMIYNKTGFQK